MNVDTEVAAQPVVRGPSAGAVTLTVNREPRCCASSPWVSLLDALREHLGLIVAAGRVVAFREYVISAA